MYLYTTIYVIININTTTSISIIINTNTITLSYIYLIPPPLPPLHHHHHHLHPNSPWPCILERCSPFGNCICLAALTADLFCHVLCTHGVCLCIHGNSSCHHLLPHLSSNHGRRTKDWRLSPFQVCVALFQSYMLCAHN